MAEPADRSPRQCRMDRVWCYVPALIGSLAIGILLGLSLLWASEGEIRRIKPRQLLDGILIWFCAGPVVIGTIRGWRKTLRRRIRRWVGLPNQST
ncbi:MAG: hypothetical protein HZB16_05625 [Armatimonadetes bacterium]|nr:hypothetical protein [Armatimonadota bacterium]